MYSQIRYSSFLLILITAIALSLLFLSCRSSDGIEVEFRDGISLPVWELLGEENLMVMENELDFPIYRGEEPPDVEQVLLSSSSNPSESTVVLSPALLGKSNVPGEANQEGLRYWDILVRIRNQNSKKLTVEFDRIVLGSSPYLSDEAFIIGDGNKFTVFGKQEDIIQEDTVISVNFFSGILEDGGVSSPKGGILVLDNRGIEPFLPNGTGRLFVDGDGFAELDQWPSTGESDFFGKNQQNSLNKYLEF